MVILSVCPCFAQVSISQPLWHRFQNTWNNCFVIHVRSQFPGASPCWAYFQQGGNCACGRVSAAWWSCMSRKVKVLQSGDCRVTLQLDAALSGRKIDRRLLATDADAELGLKTCVWSRVGQMARRSPPERCSVWFQSVVSVSQKTKLKTGGMERTQEHPGVTWSRMGWLLRNTQRIAQIPWANAGALDELCEVWHAERKMCACVLTVRCCLYRLTSGFLSCCLLELIEVCGSGTWCISGGNVFLFDCVRNGERDRK